MLRIVSQDTIVGGRVESKCVLARDLGVAVAASDELGADAFAKGSARFESVNMLFFKETASVV